MNILKPILAMLGKTLRFLFRPLTFIVATVIGLIVFIFTPSRGKRIVCAASLYAHMDHVDLEKMSEENITEYVTEVNHILRLVSKKDKAMYFPLFIQEYLWGDLDVDTLKSFVTVGSACAYVLSKMPWYLRYDTKSMNRDILTILRKHNARAVADLIEA